MPGTSLAWDFAEIGNVQQIFTEFAVPQPTSGTKTGVLEKWQRPTQTAAADGQPALTGHAAGSVYFLTKARSMRSFQRQTQAPSQLSGP